MENSNPRSNLVCPHCAGPLSKEMETSEWTVAPLVRDSFSMFSLHLLYGVFYILEGGLVSVLMVGFLDRLCCWWHYKRFLRVQPCYANSQEICKGTHAPSVVVFSSAFAGLAGGAVPALAQLASSSYYAAFSSSPLPPSLQDDKMHKSRTNSTL